MDHPAVKQRTQQDQKLKPVLNLADLAQAEIRQDESFRMKEAIMEKNLSSLKLKNFEA